MFISNVGYCFDLSIQGENVCSYYSRYGICKYGPACKHDHPINHAHSSMLTVSAVDQPSLLGQPPGRDSWILNPESEAFNIYIRNVKNGM